MFELRPYQNDLITKIVDSMRNHHRVIVVQSPPSNWQNHSHGRNCQKNNN
ncbi:hypothetical protein [uncultured Lactobacillus sp.]|nr:hypothetical protein [uncultured Lactobacillus sp.]